MRVVVMGMRVVVMGMRVLRPSTTFPQHTMLGIPQTNARGTHMLVITSSII